MFKYLLLALLLLLNSLYAYDTRLDNYPDAKEWLKDSDTNGESAYNLGVLYHQKIKDNKKAIQWYSKAYMMADEGSAASAANNLGYLYDEIKDYKQAIGWYEKGVMKNSANSSLGLAILYKNLEHYPKAIKWYEKAYSMGGNGGGANGLGYLYEHSLKDNKNAEIWYKKAIQKNHQKAIGNLAKLYHKQNKNDLGAAYLISLIDNGYTKQKVLTYLKTKWKLTDEEIKQAYQLQLKLDIPKHYKGGID